MSEFCGDDFVVYLPGAGEEYKTMTLAELLPGGFSAAEHMGK